MISNPYFWIYDSEKDEWFIIPENFVITNFIILYDFILKIISLF